MASRACIALSFALLLATAACDLTLPWASTRVERPWVSVDTTPLSLALPVDASAAPPDLRIAVASNAADFHVLVEPTDLSGPVHAGPVTGSLEVRVQPVAPSALGVGVRRATLVVHVFTVGSSYPEELPGGPWSIPITYEVKPSRLSNVAPAVLSLTQYVGGDAPTATLRLEGTAEGGAWTAAVEDATASWLDVAPASGDVLPATVTAAVRPGAPGGATATVVFRRGGSERRVPATLEVRDPPLTWSGGAVSFSVVSFSPSLPDPIDVPLGTTTGAPCLLTGVSVTTSGDPTPWLAASAVAAPGPLTLSLTRSDLPSGHHEGWVEVTCGGRWQEAVRVPVALDVVDGDLSYPRDELFFSIDRTTTPAQATRAVPLTAARAGVRFEASVEGDWLTVSPASGTVDSTATLTVSASPAALSAGPLGNRWGTIVVRHLEADGTPVERRIPAGLWLWLAEVERVAPRAVAAGEEGTVAVVAGCFPDDVLMFGDIPAAESRCVGATGPGTSGWMVRATPPALSPGAHRLWISNPLGIVRSGATLTARSPAARAAAALASPGPLVRLFFDDVRGQLWGVSAASGRLVRWSEGDGWSAGDLSLPGLHDAAIVDDGVIDALAGSGDVRVDPSSLTVNATAIRGELSPPESAAWAWTLVPTIQRHAYAATSEVAACAAAGTCGLHDVVLYGDLLVNTMVPIHGATGSPSGDLTRALFARHGFGAPQPLAAWSVERGLADLLAPSVEATSIALDRTGARALLLDEAALAGATATLLLDGDRQALPGALPGTTAAAVLSHDGTIAFAFDAAARTVRRFDLAGPPAAGLFAEVGTGIAPAADPGAGVVLALSADERTLFVGGDAQVVVVPLP